MFYMTYFPRLGRHGCFLALITLHPSRRSTIYRHNIELPLMANRNGLHSEALSRWRSAGFFRGKRYKLTFRV